MIGLIFCSILYGAVLTWCMAFVFVTLFDWNGAVALFAGYLVSGLSGTLIVCVLQSHHLIHI